ncbi:putative transcription initiation factor TFIID subunit 2 [Triangularia verruculosa]|uniref:Transcription initiation factor TFIID subunit 2 n=1 Tax=Triangularia verruculosa TaxID=2587418 RepID=A0AAN7AXQ8_9PEZI|nr:putative transcription initiation factor TFIID subunit 2 [Triangularia verruculosa]
MSLAVENGAASDLTQVDTLPPPPQVGALPFVVLKQHVAIEIDLVRKTVHGVSTMVIFPIEPDLEEISIDARQCDIEVDSITVNGFKTKASYSDPYDLVQVPREYEIGASQHHIMSRRMQPLRPLKRIEVPNSDRTALPCCVPADGSLKVSLKREYLSEPPAKTRQMPELARAKNEAAATGIDQNEAHSYKISISFRSKNIRDGLHFVGVDDGDLRYPHVYTRHSSEPGTVSCLFPCVDDPGSRHPWVLEIKCPRTLGDVFSQPTGRQPSSTTLALNGNRKRKQGEDPAPLPSGAKLTEEDKLLEMTVVCSGNLTGEQIDPLDNTKKIMTFESSIAAAQHIAFAIGPFEHIQLWSEFRTEEADEKLGANAAKIHGYCLPGRAEEVLHTCQPVVGAADYFAPEFGRYPFDSYKIVFVEDMVQDTVSGTSISLCSTRLLYPEDIIEYETEVTRKLVHALASQYFGVYIVPNRRSDNWLIIGIQWFMTDLFMRTICGNNWYRFHLKTLSDKLVEQDVSRPSLHDLGEHLHIGDFEQEFMALKAPLVLYILDQRMSKIPGSTGIIRVISKIVSTANIDTRNETTWLSAEHFRTACEKMSQYRPDELWTQWIHSAGCPKLDIKQKFNKKNLNVDITIEQTQAKEAVKEITKQDFHRELVELRHDVWAGPVPKLFTGPFTVRIHEADGTPYEHYLAITDKDKSATNLQIAYNTKYKRMKRTKKATAAAAANSSADKDLQEDDVVYYNALGDVLQTEKDAQDWGLQDWSPATQTQMDQESYEWIRLDCNFEWLCSMKTDMPPYMIAAQLQQDRDVVAQQDSMLYLQRTTRPSGVVSTIETRTAMDRRYYYGIRCMAIEDLPKMADPELNYIGKVHLILIFRHFFCDRMVAKNGAVTFPPMPNDFNDKAQFNVQCAMIMAIARTREKGRCSKDARNFLLDQLLFNDNSENDYSDQLYVATLLQALTTCLIPKKVEGDGDLLSSLNMDNEADVEFKRFIEKTIEEIDKYRRMDEWTSSYQNIWTTTALECKMRLMKARVIPVAPLEFVQYLQDDNIDLVRIKAFECLVELGMLSKPAIMKLLLSNVSTDPSPFVRDRLFKILCRGMAAIALGESKAQQVDKPVAIVEDDGFVIEQGEAEIQQRKLEASRSQSIQNAITALKEEVKGNRDLQLVFWKAVNSPWISAKEKFNLLDLCYAMFEPEDSVLLTFEYPKVWRATREINAPPPLLVNGRPDPSRVVKKQCIIRFTTEYRTEPRNKRVIEPPPPPQPEPVIKPPEPKKIKLSTKASFSGASISRQPSFSGPSASRPGTPGPLTLPSVSSDSIAVVSRVSVAQAVKDTPATPRPSSSAVVSDSIAVQRVSVLLANPSTPRTATPPPPSSAAPAPSAVNGSRHPAEKRPKPSAKKRKSDEADHLNRPKKIKTDSGRPSKIVTLPFKAWDRLPEKTRRQMREVKASSSNKYASSSSGTIVAKRPAILGGGVGGGGSSLSKLTSSGSVRARTPTVGGRGSTPILLNRGSPAPSLSSRASPAPGPPRTPLLSAAPKVRKPLPGGPPVRDSSGQSSSIAKSGTGGGGGGSVETPPVKKKSVIKLKVRAPSQSSPPPLPK